MKIDPEERKRQAAAKTHPTLKSPIISKITPQLEWSASGAVTASASLSWTQATATNCSIASYRLRCLDGIEAKGSVPSIAADATSCRVTGLSPGVTYTFLLEARATGVDPAKAPSKSETMPAAPGTPATLSLPAPLAPPSSCRVRCASQQCFVYASTCRPQPVPRIKGDGDVVGQQDGEAVLAKAGDAGECPSGQLPHRAEEAWRKCL